MTAKPKKIFSPLIAILIVALAIWNYLPTTESEQTKFHGPYKVKQVIDGDTIYLDHNGTDKIRLIGINTPEREKPYYQEATDYTASLVKDKKVYLVYDKERYDKYGRTLAYVYLEDKTTMVNYEIINAGWAKVLTIKPNDRYANTFQQGFNNAKEKKIGIHK